MSSESAPDATDPTPVDSASIRDRLRRVDDPELDRSIVELEYVERVRIDDGHVEVAFVLPTAWCSPAFAWMMATGIRDEVGSLPGVASVSVELRDHMHGAEISDGVTHDRTFQEVFPDSASGVEDVRRKLDEKARLARQHAAVETLLEAGLSPRQIVSLTPAQLNLDVGNDRAAISVRGGDLVVVTDREPLASYLEEARATGLVSDAGDVLFADPDGDPIDPGEFELVHHRARAAKVNRDGQGTVCAELHASRNGADGGE